MNRFTRVKQSLAVLAIAPLALGLTTFGTPAAVAQDATPAAAMDCSTVEPINVAFFGFAAANGFAQATWSGVQEAAAEMCATARFFDPNFDSALALLVFHEPFSRERWLSFGFIWAALLIYTIDNLWAQRRA